MPQLTKENLGSVSQTVALNKGSRLGVKQQETMNVVIKQ